MAMNKIIKRNEEWGFIKYDLIKHNFYYERNKKDNIVPYTQRPVLLNLDLTLKCNMNCIH